MRLQLYQVDAFTDRIFGGNPAAVVPLESWLPEATMQAIATENNLSETSFFVHEGDNSFGLRWFTPVAEIDLAGHPTLATAYVIFHFIKPDARELKFRTMKAGTLVVTRRGEELAMDFPARPPEPCAVPPSLVPALGKRPVEVLGSRDYMAVYESAADVAALKPDFGAIAKLDRMAVIATAPGEGDVD